MPDSERGGLRYARVPTGKETCTFCAMLASRGFVYHSAESAGAHAHVNCDCMVIPGTVETEVEGYDPDQLYDRWRKFEAIDGTAGLSDEDRHRLKQLVIDHPNDILKGGRYKAAFAWLAFRELYEFVPDSLTGILFLPGVPKRVLESSRLWFRLGDEVPDSELIRD